MILSVESAIASANRPYGRIYLSLRVKFSRDLISRFKDKKLEFHGNSISQSREFRKFRGIQFAADT